MFNFGRKSESATTNSATPTDGATRSLIAPRLPKVLGIDHVIDGVFIGSSRATAHAPHLRRAEIRHVLKLYEGGPFFPRDIIVYENPIPDGEFVPKAMLSQGVDFIMRQVYNNRRVLVACKAGISRSSTFVLSFMLESGYDLASAYDLLFTKHPEASPHPKLWESLIVHHDLKYTLDDVKNF